MAIPGSYNSINKETKVLTFKEIDPSLTYSYANYLTWLLDDRVELIKGQIFKMSPVPSMLHQEISGRLSNSGTRRVF